MNRSVIVAFLSFWVLLSCAPTADKEANNTKDTRKEFYNDDSLLVKRTFYEEKEEEANVLTEKTFKVENGDTVLHGHFKSFYKSGQLMGEEHYKNGVKHGVSQQFYPDGQVKHKGWIKNGKLDSVGILYYSDGQVEAKTFWKNGKQVGDQLHYHKNGDLQIYSFYNPAGEAIYGRKYNEKGQLINEKGRQTPQLIYDADDLVFSLGETFDVTIYVPTPPNCETELFVKVKSQGRKEVVDKQKLTTKHSKAVYEKELNELGQYYFQTTLFFKDLKTGETQTFKNGFEYEVVNTK